MVKMGIESKQILELKCPNCGHKVFREKVKTDSRDVLIDLEDGEVEEEGLQYWDQPSGNYHCENCYYEVKWDSKTDKSLHDAINRLRDGYFFGDD